MPVRPRMTPKRGIRAALLVAVGLALGPAAAAAAFAPPRRQGPPLSAPAAKLAAALNCVGTMRGAAHAPVLLVPGTALTRPPTTATGGSRP